MKAVIHTGHVVPWVESLGALPWILLPFGNRPLIEYWFELCVDLGIGDVRLVLGEAADQIETYVGDGARWGLRVEYGFLRADRARDSFLRRSPAQWSAGVLYVKTLAFPRRRHHSVQAPVSPEGAWIRRQGEDLVCLITADPHVVEDFVGTSRLPGTPRPWAELGMEPEPILDVGAYYALNMSLASGESAHYVRSGYVVRDGSSIGYNVVISPSATLRPPLLVGNEVRVGALVTLGPAAVIGNHSIIDREASLSECVVLDGTYVGRGVELKGKVVAGRRLVAPADGTVVDIDDSWLLAPVAPIPGLPDVLRVILGWLAALAIASLQVVPFLLLYPAVRHVGARFAAQSVYGTRGRVVVIRCFREGRALTWPVRLFRALSLDRLPLLVQALRGRLWVSGSRPLTHPDDDTVRRELPRYYPAVFNSIDGSTRHPSPAVTRADAFYYARFRSPVEDLRIVWGFLWDRLLLAAAEAESDARDRGLS